MNKVLLFFCCCFLYIGKGIAQCPVIEGAMVNSCGTGGLEGVNEFLIFHTTVSATAGSYTLYYGTNNPPKSTANAILAGSGARTANSSGSIVANGCAVTYVTSSSTVIPANSRVIFIPSDYTQTYDISSICSGGNIYIVFINRNTAPSVWLAGGNFGNNPPSARYLQLVNGSSNCTSNIVSYSSNWPADSDGNFVSWDAAKVPSYSNNGCSVIPPVDSVKIIPQNIAPVCTGSTTASMAFTTINNPDKYSITWNAAAIAAGFINVTNGTIPASPLSIAVPAGAGAGSYIGSIIVTKTSTNISSNPQNITITVLPQSTSTTTIAVCPSQVPYTWNGNTYNTAGTYTKTLTAASGCDSIATLVLTVKPNSTSTTAVAVCPAQIPYIWNGNTYSATGTYTKTLVSANGCDSVASLILTIKSTSASTTSVEICPAQLPFTWNGNTYNAAGTYNDTLVNAAGCDSVATLILSVNPAVTSTTAVAVCASQLPYTWNGNTYNTAGSYTKTLISASGCDSVATLVLTVNPTATSTTTVALCQSQLPYLWNGNLYNAAGTYTKTLTAASGCDSVATLVLTVKPISASTTTIAVCSNQLPYLWNGNTYNTAGTFTKTLTGSSGCDSVATLVLTIQPTSASTTSIAVCSNQLPYLWNGNTYNTAGTYTKTLMGSSGCDSVATLVLTIQPTSSSTTSIAVCSNQLPYVWNGSTYNAAGTYTKTLTGVSSCDSVATLILSVNAPVTISNSVAGCKKVSFNGTIYNNSTVLTDTVKSSFGCDSIYNVTTITVNDLQLFITATPNPVVINNPVTLSTNASVPYTVSTWSPRYLFPIQTALSQTYKADSARQITVIGTSSQGCIDTASVDVAITSPAEIFIPNTFTPNSDGRNDVFKVYGNTITAINMKIFNQWGQKIFENNDQQKGWDGISKGKVQPAGVYVYAVKLTLQDGSVIERKGSVNLIR